jgi:hypothetical protein
MLAIIPRQCRDFLGMTSIAVPVPGRHAQRDALPMSIAESVNMMVDSAIRHPAWQ